MLNGWCTYKIIFILNVLVSATITSDLANDNCLKRFSASTFQGDMNFDKLKQNVSMIFHRMESNLIWLNGGWITTECWRERWFSVAFQSPFSRLFQWPFSNWPFKKNEIMHNEDRTRVFDCACPVWTEKL